MLCPVCNAPNADEGRFCATCGSSLRQSEDATFDVERLVGQTIAGRYEIKRVIAEGGMGVVYEAEQRMGSHRRRVAIKTLLPSLSHDAALVSRFFRECGVVSQLEHPNTIKFYDFGETEDGTLYIAMEFVSGKPLTDVIEAGPMPVERVQRVLRQVCGALHEAHELGIVHRDLKPDNIILTRRAGEPDFVKLLDFGIAKRTDATGASDTKLTQQGMVLGTPPYMSPEQLAGEPLDRRSDVYSLAVIAYEMLTGHLPFEGETPWQWAHAHMTLKPPAMQPAPPDQVERAVMHALAKKKDRRPATTLAFYSEIAGTEPAPSIAPVAPTDPEGPHTDTSMMAIPPMQVAGDRTLDEPPVSPAFRTDSAVATNVTPRVTRPPRRRRRWGAALGSTALLALIATGAVFAARSMRHASDDPGSAIAGQLGSGAATEISPLVDPPPDDEPPPIEDEEPNQSKPPTQTTAPRPPVTTPPANTSPKPPVTSPPIITLPPIPTVTLPPPPAQPPPKTEPQPRVPVPLPPPKSTPPKPNLPTGNAACRQALTLANNGNIEGAVAMYNQCSSTGGSGGSIRSAKARIQAQAPIAVKRRALNGNCDGARSAVNAASSIGAGAGAQAELARSKCG